MDTNANELRAAAEQYRELSADIADALDGFCSQTELISLMSRLADITRPMQSHILATVPADDAEPVTVEKLEAWGGEKVPNCLPSEAGERRFESAHRSYRCVDRGGTWCVDTYAIGSGWFFISDFTQAADLRKLLELLGCNLKGGA